MQNAFAFFFLMIYLACAHNSYLGYRYLQTYSTWHKKILYLQNIFDRNYI